MCFKKKAKSKVEEHVIVKQAEPEMSYEDKKRIETTKMMSRWVDRVIYD